MSRISQTVSTLIVAAALAAAVGAGAQDVRVFSSKDAEDVVADAPVAADDDCPVRLPNGTCARTSDERAFSFAKSKSQSSGSSARSSSGAPAAAKAYQPARRSSVGIAGSARTAREVPLQFGLGSVQLSPQSRRNLDTLAKVLNRPENVSKRLRVIGHTDSSGSLEANRRISQQRADAVAAYLAGQGVERSRLDPTGRAFEEPLAGLRASDPRNRRVEVVRVD